MLFKLPRSRIEISVSDKVLSFNDIMSLVLSTYKRALYGKSTRSIKLTAKQINHGLCSWFAVDVEALAKFKGIDVDIVETKALWTGSNHTFIKYKGKYYDAQKLNGVKDYRQLPVFKEKK